EETDNKGFLRPDSLLVVIFVTDEDDCSHSGRLDERKTSESCYYPSTETLKDDQGNPLIGADGNPEKGQMDRLNPVSGFTTFLKGLRKDILVMGLIGNPYIYQSGTTTPIVACTNDALCGAGGHCSFTDNGDRKCSGCSSVDAGAYGGLRVYDAIQQTAFGDPKNLWAPICGDNVAYSDALARFAETIAVRSGASCSNGKENCNSLDDDCDGKVDEACVCAPGLLLCNGVCLNAHKDRNNCGSCGKVCASTETCTNGTCVGPCTNGEISCNGQCVNVQTDTSNCGACGNRCPSGLICASGSCLRTCPTGLDICKDQCVSLSNDRTNCGSCGNACSGGKVCAGGLCLANCPQGAPTDCGNACANIQNNTDHCGACGIKCNPSQVCSQGVCKCDVGQIFCNRKCTDIQTDTANCGSCGNACATGQTCSAGICQ
ncbi:MAG: hypothetical protein H6727_15705, partial [Myxococcales bacterium]|nr:hypothetical protein [Myxococcales bacterium]